MPAERESVGREATEEGGGDGAVAGHPPRVGEHTQLFEVGDLTEVDLLGELAPN